MEDNIFINICHEIMRECNNKGIKINQSFIAYYVKLLLVDPKWNISLENTEINRLDLQALVRFVLFKLSEDVNPPLTTLKMQMYFNCSFDSGTNTILKYRQNLMDRLSPLERDILDFDSTDGEDLEKQLKKIIYFLTLKCGIGNPTVPAVFNEAKAALRSIFDKNDLKNFMEHPTKLAKRDELRQLSYLVLGIRLFNRDCQKGGCGIEDLPTLLNQAVEATHTDLQKNLIFIMDNVNMLTTALDICFQVEGTNEDANLVSILPQYIEDEDVEYAIDSLIGFRQQEVYVRKMMAEVDRIADKTQYMYEEFKRCLTDIHQSVQYKTAVPASEVFPKFLSLADVWHKMQNQVVYLSKINQIHVNLQLYMKQIASIEEILKTIVGNNPILSDTDRLEQNSKYRIIEFGCNTTILDPSEIHDFDRIPLQYLGFCAWKLVESHGALIPGNPSMGVIEYDNRYYVFSCVEGALAFERTPQRFIYEALELARRKPELTNFLQIYDQLETVKNIHQLVIKPPKVVITHEVEIQTDLHPVKSNIDRQYMWNIWDLKRQAISMADISRRKTHSTQTEKSNATNAVRLQTEYIKDNIYQTKKGNYTNVPTESNFIYGLRGRTDDKQFIITLTRPIDEHNFHNPCQ